MYQGDAEVLFPSRVTPSLRDLRGRGWQRLVDQIIEQPDDSLDQLAFCLMMIRLDSCLTCHSGSYRALRGCTLCAQQAVSRFKGSDKDLVQAFEQAKSDVQHWQVTGEVPLRDRPSSEV